MEEISTRSQQQADKRRITGDAATDSALWRLSLVLKEIAESVAADGWHDKIREGGDAKCDTDTHKKIQKYALENKGGR